jgi:flavorubredoxin
MNARTLRPGIHWVGAVDWDRRLFDELVPTPEGTSYNAYVVQGRTKTALIDAVDPAFAEVLLERLRALGVSALDYIVVNHAEQDHSGALPILLATYPEAVVVTSPKGKPMLGELLRIPADRVRTVADGEVIELGDERLRFVHFPWVHWPETMVTFAERSGVLFSCDLFGAHVASGTPRCVNEHARSEAALRYFAEIMAPYRSIIAEQLPQVTSLPVELIAPSHGPVWTDPRVAFASYAEWCSAEPANKAVIVFASMHSSTRKMVERLGEALLDRGVHTELFNAAHADMGRLAVALVDAGTVVFGSPTVVTNAHPLVAHAAMVVNLLRPKARFVGILGSFGWAGKTAAQLQSLLPNLKAEQLDPLMMKGLPDRAGFERIDAFAGLIASKHREAGLASV